MSVRWVGSQIVARRFGSAQMERREVIAEMTGTGEFIDVEDLNNKYKDTPQRLEAIKQNARTMQCPTSGVQLFEDVKWVSKTTEKVARIRELSAVISQESTVTRHRTLF